MSRRLIALGRRLRFRYEFMNKVMKSVIGRVQNHLSEEFTDARVVSQGLCEGPTYTVIVFFVHKALRVLHKEVFPDDNEENAHLVELMASDFFGGGRAAIADNCRSSEVCISQSTKLVQPQLCATLKDERSRVFRVLSRLPAEIDKGHQHREAADETADGRKV
jgi:hypothetical protein